MRGAEFRMEDKNQGGVELFIKKREILLLLLVVVLFFAFRLQFTHMPLDRDEGAYAYIGQQVFSGSIPYKDTFDHKPPFIYYIYKTAFDLYGINVEAIRSFTTGYLIFTIILIYIFARTFSNMWVSLLSVLIYAVAMTNIHIQAPGSNTEVFTHFPLMLALLLILDRDREYDKVSFFTAGFLVSAAFFIKTMVVFAALVPFLYIVFYTKENRVSNIIFYSAGFLSMCALVLAWAFKNGTSGQFINDVFVYNFIYAGHMQDPGLFKVMLKGMAAFIKTNALLAAALVYAIYSAIRNREDSLSFILSAWPVSLLAAIFILKGVYPHYYIFVVPYLSVMAAIMTGKLFFALSKKAGAKAGAAAVIVMLAASGFIYLRATDLYLYLKHNKYISDMWFETHNIGNYINRAKSPGSTLFVWPNEPEIYFNSGISSMTKFIYSYPYTVYHEEMDMEYKSIMNFGPSFVVLEKNEEASVFRKMMGNRYVADMETKNFVVYRKEKQ